jgi:hypothetical protein
MKPEIGRRSDGADGGGYLLDNAARQAPARHGALADLFDAGTIRHLESCGIGTGWRCLEIGGGGGSIARWLADRVGPSGRVVATDIDTRFLDALDDPRIEVRRTTSRSRRCPMDRSIWFTRVSFSSMSPAAMTRCGGWRARLRPGAGCWPKNSIRVRSRLTLA